MIIGLVAIVILGALAAQQRGTGVFIWFLFGGAMAGAAFLCAMSPDELTHSNTPLFTVLAAAGAVGGFFADALRKPNG